MGKGVEERQENGLVHATKLVYTWTKHGSELDEAYTLEGIHTRTSPEGPNHDMVG